MVLIHRFLWHAKIVCGLRAANWVQMLVTMPTNHCFIIFEPSQLARALIRGTLDIAAVYTPEVGGERLKIS